MNTEALLKAAITHEKGKRSVTNLLSHKPEDLSVIIDLLTNQIKDSESIIAETESTIEGAEDLSEIVETVMRTAMSEQRKRVDDLCAWRIIFLSAWTEVSKVNKSL